MAFDVVGGDVNASKAVDIIDEQTIVDDLSIVPLERHGFGSYKSIGVFVIVNFAGLEFLLHFAIQQC